MRIIFEIWPKEFLIYVLIATTIIGFPMIILILLPAGRSRRKWQEMMEQSNVPAAHDTRYKRATDQYRKISVFSNGLFVFSLLAHIGLIIWGIIDYFDSGFVLPIVVLWTPAFIAVYIYSIQNMKKYNKSLEKRIIVKGVISGEIEYEPGRRNRSEITVNYTYMDPSGILHSHSRRMDYGWAYGSLKKMRTIYYDGAEVDILLNENNYRDSYLPICETYLSKFGGFCFIPLKDWLDYS